MATINTETKKQNVAVLDKLMYVTRCARYSQIHGDELIRHAAEDSGVSRANCKAAVEAYFLQVKELLLNGHSITLMGLGTFRFGIRAKAVEKKDDVDLGKIIKGRKIIFTPCSELKSEMKQVKFSNTFVA